MPINPAKPKIERVSVDRLHFDPENPRLPMRLRGSSELEVLEYMLLECDVVELMLSIGQQGFFEGEPLLVVPRLDGGMTVVEGNRRLAALRLLQPSTTVPIKQNQVRQARESASHCPTEVPVICFLQQSDILGYLGYRHITGVKDWDAYAKARYLKRLRDGIPEENAIAHQILAKQIGSTKAYVAKLLTGLMLLERANDEGILQRRKLDENDMSFSLLTTAIGLQGISDHLGLASSADVEGEEVKKAHLDEVIGWIFDKQGGSHTVLGESRNLIKLAKVVGNEESVAELRKSGKLDEAYVLCGGPIEAIEKLMNEAMSRIERANGLVAMAPGLNREHLEYADLLKRRANLLHGAIKTSVESEHEDAEQ